MSLSYTLLSDRLMERLERVAARAQHLQVVLVVRAAQEERDLVIELRRVPACFLLRCELFLQGRKFGRVGLEQDVSLVAEALIQRDAPPLIPGADVAPSHEGPEHSC